MRVKEVMNDAYERRIRTVEPRSETADGAFRCNQPLPGVLIDFCWQLRLVEVEIAASQLGPAVSVSRRDRG